jgi:hypothetical protein
MLSFMNWIPISRAHGVESCIKKSLLQVLMWGCIKWKENFILWLKGERNFGCKNWTNYMVWHVGRKKVIIAFVDVAIGDQNFNLKANQHMFNDKLYVKRWMDSILQLRLYNLHSLSIPPPPPRFHPCLNIRRWNVYLHFSKYLTTCPKIIQWLCWLGNFKVSTLYCAD